MIIDLDVIKTLLNDRSISGGRIQEITNVDKNTISKYRNGERKLMNMTLDTAVKLQSYYNVVETDKKNIKIKGIKKAVGDFNKWQGAARIYFDKENLSVETYVYGGPGSYEEFNNDNVVEVARKGTISILDQDDTITMYELQNLCKDEL